MTEMRMYDIIVKKKYGEVLNQQEIQEMIASYVADKIPDYQMAALLMAIYFNGMSDKELTDLTIAMAHSGEMVDLSGIQGIKIDKHSTGGVGDKTTLIVGPIVAACGVKVAKMSGRGLGHTGGTIDKMESIPNLITSISNEEFISIVNEIGICVIGQSSNLAPADKKLYALRDVTGTVDSIPLIAASVMSKKLAAGNDGILLDVTMGSGAFMKNIQDALVLAEKMVAIGEGAGKKTVALVTNMDIPLGNAIGNSLEIQEVVEVLKGNGPEDLKEVCINLAGNMLYLGEQGSLEECVKKAQNSLEDGSAFQRFVQMIEAQGGDSSYVKDTSLFKKAEYQYDMVAPISGYVIKMNTEQCGVASVVLGAGRETKTSEIDYTAGICFHKKTGDSVKTGDVLATLHSSSYSKIEEAEKILKKAYTIGIEQPKEEQLILARVTKEESTLLV